jgi:hypothetical protein
VRCVVWGVRVSIQSSTGRMAQPEGVGKGGACTILPVCVDLVKRLKKARLHRNGSLDHEQSKAQDVFRHVLSGLPCGDGIGGGSIGGNLNGAVE